MMAFVVRRRTVLGGAALGGAAAGLASIPRLASAQHASVTLVEESGVPESRQFASALADSGLVGKVIRIDSSLNGLLEELQDTGGTIVGLTSDPAAMIAGQLLSERGARMRVLWDHRYQDGRWRHRTEGGERLLASATHAWPVAVAHNIRDAIHSTPARVASTCNSGVCALPPSSPGMLVSWVYEAERHLS